MTGISSLPDGVSHPQVSGIHLDPVRISVGIDFIEPYVGGTNEFRFTFEKILLFTISKTPDDEDGLYLVGNVTLRRSENVMEALNGLLVRNMRHTTLPESVYVFHLEGEICVDIVCEGFELTENISKIIT